MGMRSFAPSSVVHLEQPGPVFSVSVLSVYINREAHRAETILVIRRLAKHQRGYSEFTYRASLSFVHHTSGIIREDEKIVDARRLDVPPFSTETGLTLKLLQFEFFV